MTPRHVTTSEIIDQYQCVLLDAFGVLMNTAAALPGAKEFIERLEEAGRDYFVLTNGSKFTVEKTSQSYKNRGLNISPDQIISSGSLIKSWVEEHGLAGAKSFIIGPEVSHSLIEEAGLEIAGDKTTTIDIFIITNQDGFNFLELMDKALTFMIKAFDEGRDVKLLLPNPDIIYPASVGGFGFTSGSMAEMIESALAIRFPSLKPKFIKLGKPYRPIFDEVMRRAPNKKMIMLGDQLQTDILGAHRAGLDSALLGTGLSDLSNLNYIDNVKPTYLLKSLDT